MIRQNSVEIVNEFIDIIYKEVKIKYLYPKLDQYELLDLLLELPEDQFNNLKETDLQYPWVLRNAKKFRKNS